VTKQDAVATLTPAMRKKILTLADKKGWNVQEIMIAVQVVEILDALKSK
jgi:hypothetical protein